MKNETMERIRMEALECAEQLAAVVEDTSEVLLNERMLPVSELVQEARRLDTLSFLAAIGGMYVKLNTYIPQAIRKHLKNPEGKQADYFRQRFVEYMAEILNDWLENDEDGMRIEQETQ